MNYLIHKLCEYEVKAASESIASAFMHEPIQTYFLPDERIRKEKSPEHFAILIRYCMLFGEVYTSANAEGAVLWLRPGESEITREKAEKGGLALLLPLVEKEALDRFNAVFEFLAPYHKKDAAEPHWYTFVIGVDPPFQGHGIGKALMNPVMEKACKTNTPIYLETADPANIPFYQKLGFQMVRELTHPGSGLKLWTLMKTFNS
ncbi:MAG TPA: GNAT family N-acetyltransferase [Bacteroidales bacterium]|nr:GNAT family N-acetyltransferase [Bacteroidales bacterium]